VKVGGGPVGPTTIPVGGNVTLSWTFTAMGSGPVYFTATGTAIACGGWVVEDSGTVVTTVQTPARLSASVYTVPATICTGIPFQVVVTVLNSGQATCNGLLAAIPVPSGTGLASIVTEPSQAVPAVLGGGLAKSYTWTYAAYQYGTLSFAVAESGLDGNSGLAAASIPAASVPITVMRGGVLSASAIAPQKVAEGRQFEVAIAITNSGDMNLGGVSASAAPGSGGAPVSIVSGPTPAGPLALSTGATGMFTWVCEGLAEGDISLTLAASGFDGHCTTPGIRIPLAINVFGPHLELAVSARSQVSAAEPAEFVLTLRNTGGDTAYDIVLADTLPAPLAFESASGTFNRQGALVWWDAGTIPPGGEKSFRISGLAGDKEADLAVVNTGLASFRNWRGDRKPPVSGSASITLVPFLVKRVFPNPYNPAKAVRGAMKFSGIPTGAHVRIYTTRGLLVWEGGASGGRHTVEWDGRNQAARRVVPGVYLAVLEGEDGKSVFRIIVE